MHSVLFIVPVNHEQDPRLRHLAATAEMHPRARVVEEYKRLTSGHEFIHRKLNDLRALIQSPPSLQITRRMRTVTAPHTWLIQLKRVRKSRIPLRQPRRPRRDRTRTPHAARRHRRRCLNDGPRPEGIQHRAAEMAERAGCCSRCALQGY